MHSTYKDGVHVYMFATAVLTCSVACPLSSLSDIPHEDPKVSWDEDLDAYERFAQYVCNARDVIKFKMIRKEADIDVRCVVVVVFVLFLFVLMLLSFTFQKQR